MSKAEDLALPIIEPVGDQLINFLRLDLDELETWANQIAAKRMAKAKARIAGDKSLSPFERQQLLHAVENEEIELGHVVARSYTPGGIKKVLLDSLLKSGVSDEEIPNILARIHYTRKSALAREIMSAPSPKVLAIGAKDGQSPLDAAAAAEPTAEKPSDTGETGPSSGPSLSESLA